MLRFLKTFFGFFSPYAKPFEKKVNKFFVQLSGHSSKNKISQKLLELMQEDLVAVNLWMERRYKGYIYLKKGTRQRLYENVNLLRKDFEVFEKRTSINLKTLKEKLSHKKLAFPREEEKILYLAKIAEYLKPGQRYQYQAGANFGKLLKDPCKETLIGDCNQMVTLYAYLYSLRFPLSDLKIKILPGHVCLHFEGVDLEATNGEFHHYQSFDYLAPIQEIIAVNLLDISDADEKITQITAHTLLQSAHFAYLISSMKELVTRNLHAAYQNLGLDLVKKNQFDEALNYLKQLEDSKLLDYTYHQAVTHHLKNKSFLQAKRYAKNSGKEELKKLALNHEANHLYHQKKYDSALEMFKKVGDKKGMEACYLGQYNALVKSVKDVKNLSQAKNKKSTYQKMKDLAQKAHYTQGVKQMEEILKQIQS